jgi:nitrogen fixation/metabolism regulation signal transduction histidine kinase
MKIKTKFLIVIIILAVFYLITGVILFIRSQNFIQTFNKVPTAVTDLAKSSELDSVSQFIRYYDESLTQSARNYAFTGNAVWKERYIQTVPKLDEKIKEALSNRTDEDKILFESIDASNQALIIMEEESMNLVDSGNKIKAVEILESDKYWQEKKIYQTGLEQYVANKGKGYDDTLSVSTQALDNSINEIKNTLKTNQVITAAISSFTILAGLVIYLLIKLLIFKPLNIMMEATKKVAEGNLTYQINAKNKDEIGKLSTSFDQMAKKLNESHENIEAKVTERTNELTKLNKYMTGRELKMMELKKEITRLGGKAE